MHFQSIHTFTNQKTLLHTIFCLFLKLFEGLQRILCAGYFVSIRGIHKTGCCGFFWDWNQKMTSSVFRIPFPQVSPNT